MPVVMKTMEMTMPMMMFPFTLFYPYGRHREHQKQCIPYLLMHASLVSLLTWPPPPAAANCSRPNIRPWQRNELQFHADIRTPLIRYVEHGRWCGDRPGEHD